MAILDELDLNILRELNKDARIKITKIAENTGISRPTIFNRLKKLKKLGILSNPCGLSLIKLGYKMATVGFEVNDEDIRIELTEALKICPRVLTIFKTSEKANLQVSLWGEDYETLNSVIDSFRSFDGVNVVRSNYLGTPLVGNVTLFSSLPESNVTPCNKVCSQCNRYIDNWCLGCPVSVDYKDPLKKMNSLISVNARATKAIRAMSEQ